MGVETIAAQSSKENSLWEFQLQLESYRWQVSINRQEAALRPKSRGHATWLCFQKLKIKFHCNHLILNSSEPHGWSNAKEGMWGLAIGTRDLSEGTEAGEVNPGTETPFVSPTPLLSPTHRHTLHPPRHTLQVQPQTHFFHELQLQCWKQVAQFRTVPSTYTSNLGAVLLRGHWSPHHLYGFVKNSES